MRTLWHVPILHMTDETPLPARFRPLARERYDRPILRAWSRFADDLGTLVQKGRLDTMGLVLFLDGAPYLPGTSVTRAHGNRCKLPHWIIVRALIDGGAILTGTESPELLAFHLRLLNEGHALSLASYRDLVRGIVNARDHFVAVRIARRLGAHDTGMLMMGADHQVLRHLRTLAPDIRIRHIRSFLPTYRTLKKRYAKTALRK